MALRSLLFFFVTMLVFSLDMPDASATPFTPIEWQDPVREHAVKAMIGQRKFTTWNRDQNRDFIDDEIRRRFKPEEKIDVVVDLNQVVDCSPDLLQRLSAFGRVSYQSLLISYLWLDNVRVSDLPEVALMPEVAMVEWRAPVYLHNDVSSRVVRARASVSLSPNTAEDLGLTGDNVVIAIVDSGVDDGHEAFTGKFVGGFDAVNNVVGNPDDTNGHGTHVAGIALGLATAGRTCSNPNDGTPTDCGGVATDARLVDVRVCDTNLCPAVPQGLDWLGVNGPALGVRVVNASLGDCQDSDGRDALSQHVNYLAALGMNVAVAHGNSVNCGVPAGTQRNQAPGAASLAITVGGINDQDTLGRADDTNYTFFMRGRVTTSTC